MKTILLLLAMATLIATGCQSTSSANNSNPTDSQKASLPDNGNMPTGPAGGGTLNQH